MGKKIAGIITRQSLTGLGAILVYIGVNEGMATHIVEAAGPVISGGALVVGSFIASFLEKKARDLF